MPILKNYKNSITQNKNLLLPKFQVSTKHLHFTTSPTGLHFFNQTLFNIPKTADRVWTTLSHY
jgi:hypothetical protein